MHQNGYQNPIFTVFFVNYLSYTDYITVIVAYCHR